MSNVGFTKRWYLAVRGYTAIPPVSRPRWGGAGRPRSLTVPHNLYLPGGVGRGGALKARSGCGACRVQCSSPRGARRGEARARRAARATRAYLSIQIDQKAAYLPSRTPGDTSLLRAVGEAVALLLHTWAPFLDSQREAPHFHDRVRLVRAPPVLIGLRANLHSLRKEKRVSAVKRDTRCVFHAGAGSRCATVARTRCARPGAPRRPSGAGWLRCARHGAPHIAERRAPSRAAPATSA